MKKQYVTSQTTNKTCLFKSDYSFFHNHTCLGCKNCYKMLHNTHDLKRYVPGYIKSEELLNKNLYNVPITVSKYCEPFLNDSFSRSSTIFMGSILSKGGQIILRTSKNVPQAAIELLKTYNKSIQVQLRIAFSDTVSGQMLHDEITPNTNKWSDQLLQAIELKKLVDVVIFFDPFVIGLNSASDISIILDDMHKAGLKKLIVQQLFATPFFKNHLSTVHTMAGGLLVEQVGQYYTYDNLRLAQEIIHVYDKCTEYGIELGICSNKYLHKLFGAERNCCLFDNPLSVYHPEKLNRWTTTMSEKEWIDGLLNRQDGR